jgi:flagellar basal-body rod modification protein FlgD
MTPINNNVNSVFEELGLSKTNEQKKQDFGQQDFLNLMLAQLKNQNPLEPMQNGEFLTQMAQFSSASGMQELKQSFNSVAATLQSNQALQASSLVGRTVLVQSDTGVLQSGEAVKGAVELPQSAGNLKLNVFNVNGELVRSLELGAQSAGEVKFSWDGLGNDGQPLPPGNYKLQAEATIDDETVNLETLVEASVDSVTIGQGGQGLVLNLEQIGSINLDQIKQIL